MIGEKAKKSKYPTLSFPVFLGLWVMVYLLTSLLADFVLQVLFSDVWNVDEDLFSLLAFLVVVGAILLIFYFAQRLLLQPFFGVSLRRWIWGSLAGWGLGLTAIYFVEVHMEIAPSNIEMQQLRLVLFIVISTILAQWWMLQQEIRSAWEWIAAHLGFILGMAFLLPEEMVLFTFSVFSAPDYGDYSGSFFEYKILAILYGLVTGLTLIWLKRNRSGKEKRKSHD